MVVHIWISVNEAIGFEKEVRPALQSANAAVEAFENLLDFANWMEQSLKRLSDQFFTFLPKRLSGI